MQKSQGRTEIETKKKLQEGEGVRKKWLIFTSRSERGLEQEYAYQWSRHSKQGSIGKTPVCWPTDL